jgi:hypothetical protein
LASKGFFPGTVSFFVSVHRSESTGTEEVFGTRYSIMTIHFAENLLRPLPTRADQFFNVGKISFNPEPAATGGFLEDSASVAVGSGLN